MKWLISWQWPSRQCSGEIFHTVLSSWMLGAAFVIGVSAWYLIRKREKEFALASMKVAAAVGLFAALVTAGTGDKSAYQVAQVQPMKLAAMEALYEGGTHEPLTVVGSIKIPEMLSFLATHSTAGYVPGINNLLEGGYTLPDGSTALSADEKMVNGKKAITALADFRRAKEEGDEASMQIARSALKEYMPYFGYGYIQNKEDLVPHVGLLFWSFRVMVGLGMYFILFFLVILFLVWKSGWQNSTGCTGFPCGAFHWLTLPARQDGLWPRWDVSPGQFRICCPSMRRCQNWKQAPCKPLSSFSLSCLPCCLLPKSVLW